MKNLRTVSLIVLLIFVFGTQAANAADWAVVLDSFADMSRPDLSGGTDRDLPNDRTLVLFWGTEYRDVDDVHVWTRALNIAGGASQPVNFYVGRTSSNAGFYEWKQNGLNVGDQARTGPQFGWMYEFFIYPHKQGTTTYYPPIHTGPVMFMPVVTASYYPEGTEWTGLRDKQLIINWSFADSSQALARAGVTREQVADVHVYARRSNQQNFAFLGRTGNGGDEIFSWNIGSDKIAPVFQTDPTYGQSYQFRAYYLVAGATTVGPIESLFTPFVPFAAVSDDLRITADISNGGDFDAANSHELVVRLNYDAYGIPRDEVADWHIYVQVNSGQWQYLGRPGNNAEMYEWKAGARNLAHAFREGPLAGRSYLFRVYLKTRSGSPTFVGPLQNLGPVRHGGVTAVPTATPTRVPPAATPRPTNTATPVPPTPTPTPVGPIHIEIRAPGVTDGVIHLDYGRNFQIEVHITHDVLVSPLLDVELFNNSGDPVTEIGVLDADIVAGRYREVHGYNLSGERSGTYDFGIRVSDGSATAEKTLRLIVGPQPTATPTATPTQTPTATPTRTPWPNVSVTVTDDEDSQENLIGGTDYDPQTDNKLVIRFSHNMWLPNATVTVRVRIGGQESLLKSGIPASATMLSWFDGADVEPSFRRGPIFGTDYNFAVEFYQGGALWRRVVTGVVYYRYLDPLWTPTPTQTPIPTNTPEPTATLTSTPTATATLTPTSIPAQVTLQYGVEGGSMVTAAAGVIVEGTPPLVARFVGSATDSDNNLTGYALQIKNATGEIIKTATATISAPTFVVNVTHAFTALGSYTANFSVTSVTGEAVTSATAAVLVISATETGWRTAHISLTRSGIVTIFDFAAVLDPDARAVFKDGAPVKMVGDVRPHWLDGATGVRNADGSVSFNLRDLVGHQVIRRDGTLYQSHFLDGTNRLGVRIGNSHWMNFFSLGFTNEDREKWLHQLDSSGSSPSLAVGYSRGTGLFYQLEPGISAPDRSFVE